MNGTEVNTIFDIGKDIFEGGLVYFMIKAISYIVIAKLTENVIEKAFKHSSWKFDRNSMSYKYIVKCVVAGVYAVGMFTILAGVKPLQGLSTAVLSATSLISVVLGFAAQESLGNFIAGFFIAVAQPFKVGDRVEIVDRHIVGEVKEMTFRHTVLKTYENVDVVVPNAVMNTSVIRNLTAYSTFYSVLTVQVAYDTDLDLAKKLIRHVLETTDGILDTRSEDQIENGVDQFMLRFGEFRDSGVEIKFGYTVQDYMSSFRIGGEVREKVLKAFRENDVEIPYNKIHIVQ